MGGETCRALDGQSWPRSGAPDVQRALRASRPDHRAPDVRALVLAAAERLASDPDPHGTESEVSGLDPDEVRAEVVELVQDVECACDESESTHRPSAPPASTVLFLDDPRERWADTLAALAESLRGGAAVTWITGHVLPHRALATCCALVDCGLDPRRLQLLVDDGRSAYRAALASSAFDRIDLACAPEERSDWEHEARHRPSTSFGAGLGEDASVSASMGWRDLVSSTDRVRLDEDPEAAAHDIAWAAFGRCGARGGTRAGAVGRVLVHPRVLSTFTEALLAELETARDPALEPLRPWLRASGIQLAQERDRGLDQGATLIHLGGESGFGGSKPRSGSRGATEGFRAPPRDARLTRLVFTNVEPRMPLAAPRAPVPCLSLLRDERLGDR